MMIDTLHQSHNSGVHFAQLPQTQHFVHQQQPNGQNSLQLQQHLPSNYSGNGVSRLPMPATVNQQSSHLTIPSPQIPHGTSSTSNMASQGCSDSSENEDEPKNESAVAGMDRKRRRGIIEKRRRDRINNSLIELKRLVPSAYDKQGSSKLEKAEILQLTVEHLKQLHQSGYVNNVTATMTQQKLESHTYGFRDCINEVMRYLTLEEGLDQSHPLYCRLVRHLHATLAGIEHRHNLVLQQHQVNPTHNSVAPIAFPPNFNNSKTQSSTSALAAAVAWSQQHQKQSVPVPEGCCNYIPEFYEGGMPFANSQPLSGKVNYLPSGKVPHSISPVSPLNQVAPGNYTFPVSQHPQSLLSNYNLTKPSTPSAMKLSPNSLSSPPISNKLSNAPISMTPGNDNRLLQESTPPENSSSSYLDVSGSEGNSFFSSLQMQPSQSSAMSTSYSSSILPPLSTPSFGTMNPYFPHVSMMDPSINSNLLCPNIFYSQAQMPSTIPNPLNSPANISTQGMNNNPVSITKKEDDVKPTPPVIRTTSTGYSWGSELAYG